MISSEISKAYLQEEDAVKGFRTAVENNQLRLALQILADIVDAFVEGFEAIIEVSEQEDEQQEVSQNTSSQPEPKKPVSKKSETKEDKAKESE